MSERQNRGPNRNWVKTASAAGIGTSLVLLLNKLLNGFASKFGEALGERFASNLLAVFVHEHVPLVVVFRLHVLVAFGVVAWLQRRSASRIRWQQTIYWTALVLFYWAVGFSTAAPILFSGAPGAAGRDCLFMVMSAALVLSVPARDKIQARLEYAATTVLLSVGAIAVVGGHSDGVARAVSMLGTLSAAWMGVSMIGRVSHASLLAWAVYTFALSFRVEVWLSSSETLGMSAYYLAMFCRVPALVELTLQEDRAGQGGQHGSNSDAADDPERSTEDVRNDRLAL